VNVADLVAGTRVVVCAGAGGVGKTTTAAALAAGMAQRGRRVLVLTIDPARRLAGALGLPETDDDEHEVDLAAHGMAGAGSLHAAMLDARRTFDALVREQAPTPEAAERILANPIYQQLAGAVAGSHEYMAMERLYEAWSSGRFDLIVLDTPPSRHALDFLEAPGRVTRFVDGRALRLLVRPSVRAGRLGMRVLGPAPNIALGAVERLTGVTLLADISEFLASFEGLYEGFQRRADEVSRLLASPETTFLLVTVPLTEPIQEADFFWRALRERGLPFGGVVMNKVHPAYVGGGDDRGARARVRRSLRQAGVPAATAERAAENLLDFQALADRDRANIERLEARLGPESVVEVPLLEHDVHDLEGLGAVARHLFVAG
jgi:anion-transporting  ArsA/GET3 family ATPase